MLNLNGPFDGEKQNSIVRVYGLSSAKPLWERKGFAGDMRRTFPAAAFSPDGKSVAVSYAHDEQMAHTRRGDG